VQPRSAGFVVPAGRATPEGAMILVRDVFQLRFGKAREAVALAQEMLGPMRESEAVRDARLLTDLSGPYYTLVLETTYDSLAAFEGELRRELTRPEWRGWYDRFTPLVDSGHREMFTVVGSGAPPFTAGAAMEPRATART
jgi:hypothetical protein